MSYSPYMGMAAKLRDQIPRLYAATVVGLDENNGIRVEMDHAPGVSVPAVSIIGNPAVGTRVKCMSYPPRGMLVFGVLGATLSFPKLRLTDTNDVSLISTDHPFQIGLNTGLHIAIDNNEIQARKEELVPGAFQFSTLALNASGGNVTTGSTFEPGDHNAAQDTDSTARSTTSTAYVTASNTCNVTIDRPASGAVLVVWSAMLDNSAAAETCSVSYEIRDTDGTGTVRRAASDNYRIRSVGTTADFRNGVNLVTGLAGASADIFIQLMLKSSDAGNTASMDAMSIGVMPVL